MKIIASVNEEKVLAEVTMDEIAQILGHRSRHADGFHTASIRIGSEIPIDRVAVTARFLRNASSKDLAELEKQVEYMLQMIGEIKTTLAKMNLLEDIRGS
jgi:hypothetical protein